MTARPRLNLGLLILLAPAIMAVTAPAAFALILGGEGNAPVRDPGWPKGAAAVFNVSARIAWWEGPPFGGGQWHAECRGDAKALTTVLADFAALDVKSKRVALHDGVGRSFWLNPNDEPAKQAAAQIDWRFAVWQPASWTRLGKLSADLNPTATGDAGDGPPAQIDIYVGGNVKWADVRVPKGLKIVDERLEAHGFSPADGTVLEGTVTDLGTKTPLAATVRLERIEPQPKSAYRYSTVATSKVDAKGHWVLKKAPAGWQRVVIDADGFVPRVIGYARTDDQPAWHAYDGGLVRPATVAGRVRDDVGRPLPDAEVRIQDLSASDGGRYESALGSIIRTGADGCFRSEHIPTGKATIWVYKPGYCRPGLGMPITAPKEDVSLTMIRAGRVIVTVDFSGKERPPGFSVDLKPEGGNAVGTYGGSGNINDKNQITFAEVPPGRYVIRGQSNPGSANEGTDHVTVDVKGGQTAEIKLSAK